MSTVFVGKLVLIDSKRKTQKGLISHAISVIIIIVFKHFPLENLLMLM